MMKIIVNKITGDKSNNIMIQIDKKCNWLREIVKYMPNFSIII